jgi:hypothetical protein
MTKPKQSRRGEVQGKTAAADEAKKQQRSEARIARYIDLFGELLDSYERDHPNWKAEALYWLIKYGLHSLRHYLEARGERAISWDSPFVGLHYPIDWNWKSWRKGRTTGISINTGVLTDANTRTRRAALRTLAEIMVKHITILALQEFTHNVGYEKRGNHFTPILGSDVGEFLATVRSKREQKRILERLYHPFSMGAASIDIDEESLKPNAPVPKSVTEELAKVTELIDLPPLEWTGNVDGHPLRISLIFQIHPFVVEPHKRSAHFPITVGLHLVPGDTLDAEKLLKSMEEPWANPNSWSRADQSSLWEQLFEGLRSVAKSIAPPPPPEVTEAVISVNAKIKVAATGSDPASTKSTIDKMLRTFGKTGQVIHWNCETRPVVATAEKLRRGKLSDEDFERLIFNLVSTTHGYENAEWLTHTKAPDKGRDISVQRIMLDPLVGTRRLRVIVQCKHKRGIGVSDVVHLKEQMALLEPPRVDELIIATSGRFSADAVEWIEKHNESNSALRIVMWPDSHLERLLAERPHLVADFRLRKSADAQTRAVR